MLYQIGLVLILIVAALLISKRFKNNDEKDSLIFEDEMSEEELNELDDDLNQLSNSLSKDLKSSLHANIVIIENGTPNITTAVSKAPSPPAAKSTAATTPKSIAHVILERRGESPSISAPFFDDSIDETNAPESEEVTKKVTISINDEIDKAVEKDIESYKTKRAVLAFSLTAPEISPILLRT